MKNQILRTQLVRRPKYNRFDLSKTSLSTMKVGMLYPTLCMDLVPGDRVNISANVFARAQALIAPAYTNIKIYNHFFFVPMELVMKDWGDFLSGGPTGSVFPEKPYWTYVSNTTINPLLATGQLIDFLGFPTNGTGKFVKKLDLMPFKAYQKIYNDYYRDQNLQTEVDINETGVGSFTTIAKLAELLTLRRRNYKDYFTLCLKTPQRGPAITVPVSGQTITSNGSGMEFRVSGGVSPANGNVEIHGGNITDTNEDMLEYRDGLRVSEGQINIENLRKATKLQRFAEKSMTGGGRYFELLWNNFGIRPTDETLQRPQYLGGGVQPVLISEVLQHSDPSGASSTALGTQAGHALSAGGSNRVRFLAKEYGYLMCITSIMPDTLYWQGLPRQFDKWSRFDYYFPDFDNLGEQAIKTQELYYTPNDASEFGYLPRYSEYKTSVNEIHGDFRELTKLGYWHSGRDVSSNHVLNGDFISTKDNPTDRLFAVDQSEADPFIVNIGFNLFFKRLMSKYSTPTL